MGLVVVTEKPSVAKDIARALSIPLSKSFRGAFCGSEYTVTWAIGHLLRLSEPHEIDPKWKTWRLDDLPILPECWSLIPEGKTVHQLESLRHWMNSPGTEAIINAMDPGREGEWIFRSIYQAVGCRLPVFRLWLTALTEDSIISGFRNLRPSNEFDGLGQAAEVRAKADWLVGMNLSRIYSLIFQSRFAIGRVQTPTLAMVVGRDKAISSFQPASYCTLSLNLEENSDPESRSDLPMTAQWRVDCPKEIDQPFRLYQPTERFRSLVDNLCQKRLQHCRVTDSQETRQETPPPRFYSLSTLQRDANRQFGFTAQQTLEASQSLYERHKAITYPRTDCAYLPDTLVSYLPALADAIKKDYSHMLVPETGHFPLDKRYINSDRVTDHHAIIPTLSPVHSARLTTEELCILDLINRRFLMAWQGPALTAQCKVTLETVGCVSRELFDSLSSRTLALGWKTLERRRNNNHSPNQSQSVFHTKKPLAVGMTFRVRGYRCTSHQTSPPLPFTDGTLLSAMEHAVRAKAGSPGQGIGTAATRGGILESLISRGYLYRDGRYLRSTVSGQDLISRIDPWITDPTVTASWEKRLTHIEQHQEKPESFLTDIKLTLSSDMKRIRSAFATRSNLIHELHTMPETSPFALNPSEVLQRVFGFSSFRPHQEDICNALCAGQDALVVMPTGSGKSLCYQVPGLSRGGLTLVISPLIALMHDQCQKLAEKGLSVACLHSGITKENSRKICTQLLRGELQFLFFAPERLAVPGFSDFLLRCKPRLLAIDEAHCISQWGHDFRPDYRMIAERLKIQGICPIVALTATAIPRVQEDIVQQLGIPKAGRFVHGFRRDNIAISVLSLPPKSRLSFLKGITAKDEHRPLIIYAPSRKECEKIASALLPISAAPYHAGMSAQQRAHTQEAFISGKIDCIVATIAFGMGIDKANVRTVIHAALPSSIEGYYQEIGRAGRDGLPSRALLLHSAADHHTHRYFLEKQYPDAAILIDAFAKIPASGGILTATLMEAIGGDAETAENILSKLWVHRAIDVNQQGLVHRLQNNGWIEDYRKQKRFKEQSLWEIDSFARSSECRMLTMVKHFGDDKDAGIPCGRCDTCMPDKDSLIQRRRLFPHEADHMSHIVQSLYRLKHSTPTKLFEHLRQTHQMSRELFDLLLNEALHKKIITKTRKSFTKDQRLIEFDHLSLPRARLPDLALLRDLTVPSGIVQTDGSLEASLESRREYIGHDTNASSHNPGHLKHGFHEALRRWRREEAARANVPAFHIMTDRVLLRIADNPPDNVEELSKIHGFGKKSLQRFGAALLLLSQQHQNESRQSH